MKLYQLYRFVCNKRLHNFKLFIFSLILFNLKKIAFLTGTARLFLYIFCFSLQFLYLKCNFLFYLIVSIKYLLHDITGKKKKKKRFVWKMNRLFILVSIHSFMMPSGPETLFFYYFFLMKMRENKWKRRKLFQVNFFLFLKSISCFDVCRISIDKRQKKKKKKKLCSVSMGDDYFLISIFHNCNWSLCLENQLNAGCERVISFLII